MKKIINRSFPDFIKKHPLFIGIKNRIYGQGAARRKNRRLWRLLQSRYGPMCWQKRQF